MFIFLPVLVSTAISSCIKFWIECNEWWLGTNWSDIRAWNQRFHVSKSSVCTDYLNAYIVRVSSQLRVIVVTSLMDNRIFVPQGIYSGKFRLCWVSFSPINLAASLYRRTIILASRYPPLPPFLCCGIYSGKLKQETSCIRLSDVLYSHLV